MSQGSVWVVAILLPAVLVAGCTDRFDPGPLVIKVHGFVVHDADNITVIIGIHNPSDEPATNIDFDVNLGRNAHNGSYKDANANSLTLARAGLPRNGYFFDDRPTIPANSWRNFTVDLQFTETDAPMEPTDYYRLSVNLDYQHADTQHNTNRHVGCWTAEGVHAPEALNCSYFASRSRSIS